MGIMCFNLVIMNLVIEVEIQKLRWTIAENFKCLSCPDQSRTNFSPVFDLPSNYPDMSRAGWAHSTRMESARTHALPCLGRGIIGKMSPELIRQNMA